MDIDSACPEIFGQGLKTEPRVRIAPNKTCFKIVRVFRIIIFSRPHAAGHAQQCLKRREIIASLLDSRAFQLKPLGLQSVSERLHSHIL